MKKALLTLVTILATCTCAFADTSGQCGSNITWTFEEATKTLKLSGSGDMYENEYASRGDGFIPGYLVIINIRNNIKNIVFEGTITGIGDFAFDKCINLETITLPESLKRIGSNAFQDCSSLSSIHIPRNVSLIRPCFIGCDNLKKITVDINNTKFDSRNNCNGVIETAANRLVVTCPTTVIPKSVTNIGSLAYLKSNMLDIDLPKGVTTIEEYAFNGCEQLTTAILPSTLTTIGPNDFRNCTNLEAIAVKATQAPAASANSFEGVNKETCTLYIPQHRNALSYITATGWKDFENTKTNIEEFVEAFTARKLCDTNKDGEVNVTDVVRIYNYIISGK